MIYHTSDEQANHSTIGHISQLRPTHVVCYLAKNRSIHASIQFTYEKSMNELFRNRKSKDRHKMTKAQPMIHKTLCRKLNIEQQRTPLITMSELMCPGRVKSFCSTCVTRCFLHNTLIRWYLMSFPVYDRISDKYFLPGSVLRLLLLTFVFWISHINLWQSMVISILYDNLL